MKRLLLIMTFILLTVFHGCGNKDNTVAVCPVCKSTNHIQHSPCSVCLRTDHLDGACVDIPIPDECDFCGSIYHTTTEHPICMICGKQHVPAHEGGITIECAFCGQGTHTTEEHKKCDICGDLYHTTENCIFKFCKICSSSEHDANEHPYCEVPNCTRSAFHTTAEHPICKICGQKHVPACEGGIATECLICGQGTHTTDRHEKCSVCGRDGHTYDRHPECARCHEKHADDECKFCTYCGKITEHTTKTHPECKYCEAQTTHFSEGHPRCDKCGKLHKSAYKCQY